MVVEVFKSDPQKLVRYIHYFLCRYDNFNVTSLFGSKNLLHGIILKRDFIGVSFRQIKHTKLGSGPSLNPSFTLTSLCTNRSLISTLVWSFIIM